MRVLARSDSAGATHAFAAACRDRGVGFSFDFRFPVDARIKDVVDLIPQSCWAPAIQTDGETRDGAWVAEPTGMFELDNLATGVPGAGNCAVVEAEEVRALRREKVGLRRANEIPRPRQRFPHRRSSTADSSDRDLHRLLPGAVRRRADCAVLSESGITIAPSTYHVHKACPVSPAALEEVRKLLIGGGLTSAYLR